MKKIILALAVVLSVVSCKTVTQPENDLIVVDVFLHNVENDKVKVTVNPGRISSDSLKFYLPKTVPGTYAINDYGQFSQDLVALDYDGEAMETTRNDDDTWVISILKLLSSKVTSHHFQLTF